MSFIQIAVVFVLQLAAFCAIMFMIISFSPKEVVYDCTWVEISPDVPPKVREECRKQKYSKQITV